MNFKQKLWHLKIDRNRYINYLEDPGEPLTLVQKVKLYKEIVRLQREIDMIEMLPISQLWRDYLESTSYKESVLLKPLKKIKPLPKIPATWNPLK